MLRDCGVIIMFLLAVCAFTADRWNQDHKRVKKLEKRIEKVENMEKNEEHH